MNFILGQLKSHQRGTQYSKVFCRANSRRKTPAAASEYPEGLTAFTSKFLFLGHNYARAPYILSTEYYQDLQKSFKTAQALADMIWNRWTREYPPQWKQRSNWSKEHVRKVKEGEFFGW